MNVHCSPTWLTSAVLASAIGVASGVAVADNDPVATTFTYQGRLTEQGNPASDPVDLVFRLYDAAAGGTLLGELFADAFTIGEDGHFTIDLDFGDEFTGAPRWLEIEVNDVTLSPRQPIMAAPHAMVATTVANVPTKALVGNYSGITGVGTLDSLNVSGNVIATSNSGITIQGIRTSNSGSFPGIHGESQSNAAQASGTRGYITSKTPGANSAGVWGENKGTTASGHGVRGTHLGAGNGIFGHSVLGVGVRGETDSSDGYAGYFVGGRNYFQGNVGIGTTNPQRRLDIFGAGARISSLVVDGPRLELKGDSITSPLAFTVGALDFVDGDDDFVGGISYTRSLFGERLWLSAGGEGRVAIDHDGRVGINADVPRQQLSVGNHLDLYSGSINNPARPSVRASSASNIIINAMGAGAMFINHDSGTGGVRFHNGGQGISNEIMRLTGDGRLGIGTSNPLEKLHVNGFVRAEGLDITGGSNGAGSSSISFGDCGSTIQSLPFGFKFKLPVLDCMASGGEEMTVLTLGEDGPTIGGHRELGITILNNAGQPIARVDDALVPALTLAPDGGHAALRFGASELETAMSIRYMPMAPTGAPMPSLNVMGGFVGFGLPDGAMPTSGIQLPMVAGSPAGSGLATAWNTYSSGRWKEHVQPIPDALETVLALHGVTFDWRTSEPAGVASMNAVRDIGFIAEEVGAVVPELVVWEQDGIHARGLKYDRITALTVEAIKEQQRQFEAQRNEVESLRLQNDELRAQIEALQQIVQRIALTHLPMETAQ